MFNTSIRPSLPIQAGPLWGEYQLESMWFNCQPRNIRDQFFAFEWQSSRTCQSVTSLQFLSFSDHNTKIDSAHSNIKVRPLDGLCDPKEFRYLYGDCLGRQYYQNPSCFQLLDNFTFPAVLYVLCKEGRLAYYDLKDTLDCEKKHWLFNFTILPFYQFRYLFRYPPITMFFLYNLERQVTLHPSYFGRNMHELVTGKLLKDVEGTCTGLYYIITIMDTFNISEGRILPGSGLAEFTVGYRAVVWRPFKGETVRTRNM
ncbi:hypothetical protein EYC84_011447 [Monilinia fructicola]|uniref:DNA-directed RNA polymerase subunit n=1 Tax=Monilinia fructicola TaxID=38448 RepID=A0A5M9J8C4_MONFR|nr:hypothetical protein EYC84_011447 [Monilinia fructicola]